MSFQDKIGPRHTSHGATGADVGSRHPQHHSPGSLLLAQGKKILLHNIIIVRAKLILEIPLFFRVFRDFL